MLPDSSAVVPAAPAPAATCEQFLLSSWPLLRQTALQVVQCVDDADDAAAVAAAKIWQRWRQFDPAKGSREAWAWQIARRAAIDLLRQHRRQQRVLRQLQVRWCDVWLDPAELAVAHLLAEAQLAMLWEQLTPHQRLLVHLRAAQCTDREIAARLEQPLGTVKTHLRRLRQHVQRQQSSSTPGDSARG